MHVLTIYILCIFFINIKDINLFVNYNGLPNRRAKRFNINSPKEI